MTNFKKGDCVTLLPSSPYYENQLPEWNNGIGVIRSDIPVSVTDEYTVIIHSENYSNSYPLKDLKIVYKKDREKRKKQMVRDITLEDCLIAFRSEGISIRVNTMGEFFEHQPKTGKWEVNDSTVFWILNKPLQDQSNKTKDFLFNLLK